MIHSSQYKHMNGHKMMTEYALNRLEEFLDTTGMSRQGEEKSKHQDQILKVCLVFARVVSYLLQSDTDFYSLSLALQEIYDQMIALGFQFKVIKDSSGVYHDMEDPECVTDADGNQIFKVTSIQKDTGTYRPFLYTKMKNLNKGTGKRDAEAELAAKRKAEYRESACLPEGDRYKDEAHPLDPKEDKKKIDTDSPEYKQYEREVAEDKARSDHSNDSDEETCSSRCNGGEKVIGTLQHHTLYPSSQLRNTATLLLSLHRSLTWTC